MASGRVSSQRIDLLVQSRGINASSDSAHIDESVCRPYHAPLPMIAAFAAAGGQ
jgi:hypothetical protein